MANLKSSIKDIKLNTKRRNENVVFKSRVKNSIKNLEKAILTGDKELANKLLKETIVNIDKAYSKGLIKENTRNRQKSRLSNKVKEMNK